VIEHCAKMAECAQIAYMDGPEAKKEFRKLGYTVHKFMEVDGAQCHLASNKNEVVLAFRGTEPKEFSDIKADLNAWPDKAFNGHGMVHNGFQEEVNKLWDKIMMALGGIKNLPEKDFFICGHSLGGAMATIATSRLVGGEREPDCLYTYGSPRVGNKKFVKSFAHIPHFRHVNNNDLVTAVPFAIMGYRHHCPPRYINHYGRIRKMTKWQRTKDKWRGRLQALKKRMPFDGAYDHSMVYYCKYCKENEFNVR
jgi:triacylglycerol lipase